MKTRKMSRRKYYVILYLKTNITKHTCVDLNIKDFALGTTEKKINSTRAIIVFKCFYENQNNNVIPIYI